MYVVAAAVFELFEECYGLPTECNATEFARANNLPSALVKAWVKELNPLTEGRLVEKKVRRYRVGCVSPRRSNEARSEYAAREEAAQAECGPADPQLHGRGEVAQQGDRRTQLRPSITCWSATGGVFGEIGADCPFGISI